MRLLHRQDDGARPLTVLSPSLRLPYRRMVAAMSEANKKAAAEIRAFAAAFHIAGDAVVTFRREGCSPETVRLDDLLKRLEYRRPEQLSLFAAENRVLQALG